MAFECPDCKSAALEIVGWMEMPADTSSDEITLQIIACASCGFQGAAVYAESRRGALDSESWQHAGYQLGPADYARLAQAVRQCPQPGNSGCPCPGHQHYGQTDPRGVWAGLTGTQILRTFAMQRKD